MPHSHWHGHIEINYLFGCSAEYLIHGKKISVPEGRMLLFWASMPHQMIASQGDGDLVNIYIPLQAFLSWSLPSNFVSQILKGQVLVSDHLHRSDMLLTQLWEQDIARKDERFNVQVINEMRARVSRMALENYSNYRLVPETTSNSQRSLVSGLSHIEAMLRYIADNYDQRITIKNVAEATNLHPNYAMKLFNRVLKIPIKQYINQLRLQHAQALLIDTKQGVLAIALEAGFGSISRFYDVFQREFQMSPQQYRKHIVHQ
jgi:AraC-like DNA-binding protein